MEDDPFSIFLVLIGLVFFTVLQNAYRYVNKIRLEIDKTKNTPIAKILNFISNNTDSFFSVMNIMYYIFIILLISKISTIVTSEAYSLQNNFAKLSIVIIISFLILIINEIIFQTAGKFLANQILLYSAFPSILLFFILYPISLVLSFVSKSVLRISPNETNDHFDIEDLSDFVSDEDDIKKEDKNSAIQIFKNALEFSETKLRECMIPRPEILAHDLNDETEELMQLFISSGLSKIPVYKDSIDEITGYIHVKEFIKSEKITKKLIRNIDIFPETMLASKLLQHFIQTSTSIAIIVDEFGGTSGLITIEDVLEEITGEIEDEYDTDQYYEKKITNREFLLSARLEIDYLNEKYKLDIPESEEYETLAGYIIHSTENIPESKEIIQIGQFSIEIIKSSETKIELIKLSIK